MDGQVRETGLAVLFGRWRDSMFVMRAEEHVVRETEFCDFLRRHLRDPELFTAFNVMTGRWFLGLWVRKDQGVAQDVEDLGANLELATRGLVKDLERSRDGITKEDMRNSLLRKERTFVDGEVAFGEEFQEMQDWTQKKSGSPIPALLG